MTLINLQPVFDFLGIFLGGPATALVVVLALLKIFIILQHVLLIVPLTVWAERRIIGLIQDRPEGRWMYYSINQAAIEDLSESVEALKAMAKSVRPGARC